MVALSLIALTLAVSPPGDVARWSAEIDAAALRCGVPGEWIARVMQAESGGRTMLGGRPIRSRKGAIGLMQLMPGTWAEMQRDLGLGGDPDLPADNIVAGACYLRRMYDRFGYPGLFGAYNAGPGRYDAWLAGEATLPGETVAYLRSVGSPAPVVAEPPATSPPALFVVRREMPPSSVAQSSTPAMFVLRREVP